MSAAPILFTVRYLGTTGTRPTRMKATCDLGSATVAYDHALDFDANERAAVREALRKCNVSATQSSLTRIGRLPNRSGDTVWIAARPDYPLITNR